jgi:hypothetical protein
MKLKTTLPNPAVTAVAIGLLLCASQVSAQTVIFDPSDPDKATGVAGLDINGTVVNVNFISRTTALALYGEEPGDYDATTSSIAAAAVDAANAALNAAGASQVGSEWGPGTQVYSLGFNFVLIGQIGAVQVWEGASGSETGGTWIRPSDSDLLAYKFDERTFIVQEGE